MIERCFCLKHNIFVGIRITQPSYRPIPEQLFSRVSVSQYLTLLLIQFPDSTLACFYGLFVNGVSEDLNFPQASTGVQQCLTVYNNIVTLRQDSYLLLSKHPLYSPPSYYYSFILVDGFDVGVRLNITLDFRTNNCSGLLLYVASSIYSDHLLVELRNGQVS